MLVSVSTKTNTASIPVVVLGSPVTKSKVTVCHLVSEIAKGCSKT
jgi:hypothetical protein